MSDAIEGSAIVIGSESYLANYTPPLSKYE